MKNTIAKMTIVVWILFLVFASLIIARYAAIFNINEVLGLDPKSCLPANIVNEGKLLILMVAVSILGGTAFMIKDFYRSVKYANLYDRAYGDFRSGIITPEGFQRLVTLNIYAGRFNHTWIYWFFVQPILSSALGIIAFFIARSGLWVLQGATNEVDVTIRGIYLYAVFTFLAGFSSHKFIAWLDRLADKIFSSTLPEEKKMEMRTDIEAAASADRGSLRNDIASKKNADSEKSDARAPFPNISSNTSVGPVALGTSLPDGDLNPTAMATSDVEDEGEQDEPLHTTPSSEAGFTVAPVKSDDSEDADFYKAPTTGLKETR